MRAVLIAAVIALGASTHVPGLAQGQAGPRVQITFEPGGLVTVVANGAPAREILAEWTRLGGSRFINADRLNPTPLTLEYRSQPEAQVIGSILRGTSGFVIGPRREGNPGASSFELVYILATSNPSGGSYVPPASYTPPQQQVTTPGAPDDELAPVQGRGVQPPGPQPVPGAPPPGPQPTPTPDASRPAGSTSSVVVPVVPVISVPPTTTTAPPPPGRGGGAGS